MKKSRGEKEVVTPSVEQELTPLCALGLDTQACANLILAGGDFSFEALQVFSKEVLLATNIGVVRQIATDFELTIGDEAHMELGNIDVSPGNAFVALFNRLQHPWYELFWRGISIGRIAAAPTQR